MRGSSSATSIRTDTLIRLASAKGSTVHSFAHTSAASSGLLLARTIGRAMPPRILIQVQQAIKRFLDIRDQFLHFGLVACFQSEQFQASLALLQRVAAVMRQASQRLLENRRLPGLEPWRAGAGLGRAPFLDSVLCLRVHLLEGRACEAGL